MSKQHFLIVSKRSGLECADLGSKNGTFVNGSAVGTCPLVCGSVIRAGDTIFLIADDRWGPIEERAKRCARTPFSILLQGETGTGKELLARCIHKESNRLGPFFPINCAALPKDLLAAELFGHAKGAFSGAAASRLGIFRAAERGTILLDEIGDLPLELQPALLRVLEEQRVRPVGSDVQIPIDVRILAATHIDLTLAVHEQRFRADLYARVARVVLHLPALRERREKVLELAQEFAGSARLTANAAESLALWDWPLNVRELRSTVEVAAAMAREPGRIRLADLAEQNPQLVASFKQRRGAGAPAATTAHPPHPAAERRERLQSMLESHRGNVSHVAAELGKPRAQVYRWVKALGLDAAAFRRQ